MYILNEQFIVKPGTVANKLHGGRKRKRKRKRKRGGGEEEEHGSGHEHTAFQWHRDADYLRHAGCPLPVPFVSVWCALDDIHEKNGTLVFAPLNDVSERVLVRGEAGTVVLISSEVLHRSSGNEDTHDRRVWMPQYSAREQRWPAAKSGTNVGLVALGINVSVDESQSRDGER
jgi:hypothetical protein